MDEYLSDFGYTRSGVYSRNCIVSYQKNGEITHFAKISNGVVTAKMGNLELVEHKYYDAYYNSNNSYGKVESFYKW